jgi:prepilin-type N-terminal cleavage/methylation domain-containing protein
MRARGFTMLEIAIVATVAAVVASAAIMGLTSVLDSSRREQRLQAFLDDLVRRRAAHLATAAPIEACLVVRQVNARTLDFEERTDCRDGGTARPAERKQYDVTSITLNGPSSDPQFCVDPLARVRDCGADPIQFVDATLTIDADKTVGADGTVTWTRGGRIRASFASSIDASAQPHLSDVGATATPEPTYQGGYQGLSTDPRGLLE